MYILICCLSDANTPTWSLHLLWSFWVYWKQLLKPPRSIISWNHCLRSNQSLGHWITEETFPANAPLSQQGVSWSLGCLNGKGSCQHPPSPGGTQSFSGLWSHGNRHLVVNFSCNKKVLNIHIRNWDFCRPWTGLPTCYLLCLTLYIPPNTTRRNLWVFYKTCHWHQGGSLRLMVILIKARNV